MRTNVFIYFWFAFLLTGCRTIQHISKTDVRYEVLNASIVPAPDESITRMIEPYKVQLDVQMNEVLGNVARELTKRKPESTLGNWYTDAMMAGIAKTGYTADLAISNYGGLRVPQITAGPLTRGELYELCPFENLMVIMDVPGNILDTIFQQIASTEGWPISAGVRMVIKDKKMIACTIDNEPIQPTKIYKVVMPDYVSNGGDGLNLLIPLFRVQTGLLVRDVLIEYAIATQKAGKEINATIEGRIVIEQK